MKLILSESQAESLKSLLESDEVSTAIKYNINTVIDLDRVYHNLTNPNHQLEY